MFELLPKSKQKNSKNGTQITIFYHRDPTDLHRGQGVYLSNLYRTLSHRFSTKIVGANNQIQRENSRVQWNFITNILSSSFNAVRHFLSDRNIYTGGFNNIFIGEDIYISPVVIILSKISRSLFIYRASDFGISYRENISKNFKFSRLISFVMCNVENFVKNSADYIIVPSLKVKEDFRKNGVNQSKIFYFPYTVNLKNPDENLIHQFITRFGLGGKMTVVFVGPMDYPPNLKSVFKIMEIAQDLKSLAPNIEFLIVGRGTDWFNYKYTSLDNVIFLGEIEDLDTLLYSCCVGIAPVLTPGGLSIKIVDYLVHGLKVVTTPEGAYGIPDNNQMIVTPIEHFKHKLIELSKESLENIKKSVAIPDLLKQHYLSGFYIEKFTEELEKILLE